MKGHFSSSAVLGWAAVILLILVFGVTLARIGVTGLRGDSSVIWLYLTGVEASHPTEATKLEQQLSQAVNARSIDAASRTHYIMRANNRNDYSLSSWLIGRIAAYRQNGTGVGADYAKAIARTYFQASIIISSIAFFALLLGVGVLRDSKLVVALSLTITSLSLVSLLSNSLASAVFLFLDGIQNGKAVYNLVHFGIDSSGQFSIFELTPHATLLVAALLIFAWRWAGWWIASYLLAAATIFLDQTAATVLIGSLIGIDLIYRKNLLLRWPVIVSLVVTISISIIRNLSRTLAIFPLGETFLGVTLLALSASWTLIFVGLHVRYRMKSHEASCCRADMITSKVDSQVLLVFLLVSLPITYVIASMVDDTGSYSLYYQLVAVLSSLYLPIMLFGLMCWLVTRHWPSLIRRHRIFVAGATALAVGFGIFVLLPGVSTKPLLKDLKSVAAEIGKPIWTPLAPDNEAAIYMTMAHSIDSGADNLSAMLEPASGFTYLMAKQEPYLETCNGKPKHLIVWLHTWSANLGQVTGEEELRSIEDACIIAPNFNGAGGSSVNTCGSHDSLERIRNVILDAQARHGQLPVTLIGVSGGGMHALLTLGMFPGLVQAATIWVPIYDQERWYWERPDHRPELETCFGRPPSPNDVAYLDRSPKSVLSAVRDANVIVNLGKSDEETPAWHARSAVSQMRSACSVCTIDLIEWEMGHTYKKDVLLTQIHKLIAGSER